MNLLKKNQKILDLVEACNVIEAELFPLEKKEKESVVVSSSARTNVVTQEKLREIQGDTLRLLKEYLSKTFGPMGSNTKIITGNEQATVRSSYSKDGLKVLEKISSSGTIEMSIIEEINEAVHYVESQVGDGTTSTIILSSLIFDNLINVQKRFNVAPYQLIRDFKSIVEEVKKNILSRKKECTLQDIYNIAMVSTNGNVEAAENIMNIYKEYGMTVDLSVGISNTTENILKVYDGLTLTEGMSDNVYINNPKTGECIIPNAKVYHFTDPIDTMEMIGMFEAILNHNIYEQIENNEAPIPTVITCPRISKDMSGTLKKLAEHLYQFNKQETYNFKPPVLIITNVVASDEAIMDDIANLCGCRSIGKYIDPKMLQRDRELGLAPTLENVHEFCGSCERVVADSRKTKFINPLHMRIHEEDGTVSDDPIYTALVNFLKTEIENCSPTESSNTTGLLKRRLSALKANMVEYLVGGITISDRDMLKDLVEDAVKNCKSAAENGYGYAANFEGLRASYEIFTKYISTTVNKYKQSIAYCIYNAYYEISKILYYTVEQDEDTLEDIIYSTIDTGSPYNISNGISPAKSKCDSNEFAVSCSIMTDINILDTLSKIITVMVTCNQCLVQAPSVNVY